MGSMQGKNTRSLHPWRCSPSSPLTTPQGLQGHARVHTRRLRQGLHSGHPHPLLLLLREPMRLPVSRTHPQDTQSRGIRSTLPHEDMRRITRSLFSRNSSLHEVDHSGQGLQGKQGPKLSHFASSSLQSGHRDSLSFEGQGLSFGSRRGHGLSPGFHLLSFGRTRRVGGSIQDPSISEGQSSSTFFSPRTSLTLSSSSPRDL